MNGHREPDSSATSSRSLTSGDEPTTTAQRSDEHLASLLKDHPDAMVVAFDSDGRTAILPASIELFGQHVDLTDTPLDAMAPASWPAVFALLALASVSGAAQAPVVLADGRSATCHLVDVRETHGVLVGMLTSAHDDDMVESLTSRPPVVPKTGRMDKDAVGMIQFADARICQILGYEVSELIGMRSLDLVHPDDQARAIEAWMEMLTSPEGSTRLRARQRCRDGSWVWMELTNANRLEGPEGCVVTEMLDVSEETTALEHLRQREELLSRLAEALPAGVLQVDSALNVVFTNARLHQVLGTPAARSAAEQLQKIASSDRATLAAALDGVLQHGRSTDLEVDLNVAGADSLHRCSIAVRVLTDEDGLPSGAVLCIDDVTDASVLRAELVRRANIDELTGCLSRTAVLEVLDARLRLHRDASLGTTVLYLDLDGFKEVNDTFGHHEGDQLLAKVARRITTALRVGDVLGRLGGDEFIVVASALTGVDPARQLGARISSALSEPLEIVGGLPMRIRASIGIAWSSGPHATASDLTMAADRAMYQSKRSGDSEPVAVLV